jgi:hypothetical protein
MHWEGNYGICLNITKREAMSCSHSGQCDAAVAALRKEPRIARQVKSLDPETLARELYNYGAWDEEELEDHDQNISRMLWIACGDIAEGVQK